MIFGINTSSLNGRDGEWEHGYEWEQLSKEDSYPCFGMMEYLFCRNKRIALYPEENFFCNDSSSYERFYHINHCVCINWWLLSPVIPASYLWLYYDTIVVSVSIKVISS